MVEVMHWDTIRIEGDFRLARIDETLTNHVNKTIRWVRSKKLRLSNPSSIDALYMSSVHEKLKENVAMLCAS